MRILLYKLKFLYRRYTPLYIREFLFLSRHIFAIIFTSVCILFANRRNYKKSKNVLLVRLDGIGDFIIWLDSAKKLKETFGQNTLSLLCGSDCAKVAQATGYFNDVYIINKKNMQSFNPIAKIRLRKNFIILVFQSLFSVRQIMLCTPNLLYHA